MYRQPFFESFYVGRGKCARPRARARLKKISQNLLGAIWRNLLAQPSWQNQPGYKNPGNARRNQNQNQNKKNFKIENQINNQNSKSKKQKQKQKQFLQSFQLKIQTKNSLRRHTLVVHSTIGHRRRRAPGRGAPRGAPNIRAGF